MRRATKTLWVCDGKRLTVARGQSPRSIHMGQFQLSRALSSCRLWTNSCKTTSALCAWLRTSFGNSTTGRSYQLQQFTRCGRLSQAWPTLRGYGYFRLPSCVFVEPSAKRDCCDCVRHRVGTEVLGIMPRPCQIGSSKT